MRMLLGHKVENSPSNLSSQ
uniref:Uncharacterized protein n=1 Tax=Anguilla anguilla TaxID=7936 RepID=A0A0E9RTR2_ANGAN